MGAFSCTPAQLAQVVDLVGQPAIAQRVCSTADVGGLGASVAVTRYLAARLAAGTQEAGSAGPWGQQQQQAADRSLNTAFLLFSGYLVFTMQAGFAMLCAGHIRLKNNSNILMKNVLDCAMGTLAWYLIGNSFAFGELNGRANPFIGAGDFALSLTGSATQNDSSYEKFYFHWAFSAAAATIVAGAVAERITFVCYMIYTCMMSGIVYPVVVHWLWTRWGWLSPLNERPLFGSGAMDFAGGVAVHVVGGMAALIGVRFCGPRIGRFDVDGASNKGFRDNNVNLVVLGTFLLWFGWYGFNPGSAAAVTGASSAIVARTAVTTTIAAGTGGVAALFVSFFTSGRRWDVMQLCNGVLCGLVAVTPGCGLIDVWAGVLVAVLGGALFLLLDMLMLRRLMDDVVAAAPMHLGCGALGTLFVGLFAREEYVVAFYGPSPTGARRWGAFFGGDGTLLAAQVVALLATFAWVALFYAPFFWLMRRLDLMRVPLEQELAGLDASKYGVITTNELPTVPAPRQKTHV